MGEGGGNIPKLVKDINPLMPKKSKNPNHDKDKNTSPSQSATTKDKVLKTSRKKERERHVEIGKEKEKKRKFVKCYLQKKKVGIIPCLSETIQARENGET